MWLRRDLRISHTEERRVSQKLTEGFVPNLEESRTGAAGTPLTPHSEIGHWNLENIDREKQLAFREETGDRQLTPKPCKITEMRPNWGKKSGGQIEYRSENFADRTSTRWGLQNHTVSLSSRSKGFLHEQEMAVFGSATLQVP